MTVTDSAIDELFRIADGRGLENDKFLRLATPPVWIGEGDWGISISESDDDDEVFGRGGRTALVMAPSLSEQMSDAVLDFKDTPDGARFTLDVY
ncbi:MAG: hypothetical protein O2821_02755 [Chloroflexi bacterium]|nr:hypothetical protein [Chloroflexota bacterium]MDA1227226.1 hypothetical protein [Chloroflexota bacterium]